MQQVKQQRGAAMLFFIMFFVMASGALTFLLSRSITSDLFLVNSLTSSKQTYLTVESALEDVALRVMNGESVDTTVILTDEVEGIATTTVTHDLNDDIYTIQSVAKVGRTVRRDIIELIPGDGTSFNYGLQTGNGGFDLVNSASITGNAFSNGTVQGQGSSIIYGDVISAGATGLITGIHATGSTWSQTLDDSTVDGDAYYNATGTPSTVNGDRNNPFTVIDPEPLPIPDSKIDEWKTGIVDTGTVIPASSCSAGEYLINSNTSIGNVKIECNLRVRKTGSETILTLTGPIWVTGNISFEQGPELEVDPVLGSRTVQIIADNPADRLTSSKISIANSTEFRGSGHSSSFIMLVSQNNSSELGGTETAIDIGQSSNGDLLLYSGHGKVVIGNQIYLKSVTGHRIEIGNNSNITYDTGLTNVLFSGGPGGSYKISDWYQE